MRAVCVPVFQLKHGASLPGCCNKSPQQGRRSQVLRPTEGWCGRGLRHPATSWQLKREVDQRCVCCCALFDWNRIPEKRLLAAETLGVRVGGGLTRPSRHTQPDGRRAQPAVRLQSCVEKDGQEAIGGEREGKRPSCGGLRRRRWAAGSCCRAVWLGMAGGQSPLAEGASCTEQPSVDCRTLGQAPHRSHGEVLAADG